MEHILKMHLSTFIVFLSAVGLSLAAEEVQQFSDQEQQQPDLFGNRPPKRVGFGRPSPRGFGQQTGSFGENQQQGDDRPRRPHGFKQQDNEFNVNQGQEFDRSQGFGRPPKHGFGKPPPLSHEQQEQSGSSHQNPVDEPTQQQYDVEVSEPKVEQGVFEDLEQNLDEESEKEVSEVAEKEEESEVAEKEEESKVTEKVEESEVAEKEEEE